MKTIDLQEIRRAIESAPTCEDADAAVVSRKWLAQVERELQAGRDAEAALAKIRGGRA